MLIGGGVGLTPLMSVIRYLTDRGWPQDIYLLYCCRSTGDFVFREELEHSSSAGMRTCTSLPP